MEALNEFINKNPDVPVKVRLVTVVFFILTFTLTRALLSSLVLTALYTVLHTLILFVIRRNKLLDLSDVHDRKQDLIEDDSDEEDFAYEPGKLGYFGGSDAQYEVVQRKPAFAHKTDLGTSLRIESKVRPTPDRYFRQNPTNASVGFDSRRDIKFHQERAKELDFEDRPMYGERTAKGFEMYRKPPNSNDLSSIGVDSKSPKTPSFFGVNRWGLSRQPLHPTAINTPLTSESMPFAGQKRNAKPTRASMFHKLKNGYGSDQNISPSGPQTSSPFHDKSQVGLWDTMSLSAIAGSPTNFISPINSPGIVGEKNSLQNVLVSSPSSEKGMGFSRKHVPRHTTGHPVDVKRHPQPLNVVSSQWQKWNHKQTTVTVGGRPKLQSPVTVRIAHPDRPAASLSMSRSYRTPLGSEETSESLRKDVILSALREKRKRGKAVENQSVNRSDHSSLEDTQTGSHIKKRRLNNTEDISEPSAGPVRKHSRSGAFGKRGLTSSPAVNDSDITGRSISDSREVLDSSYGNMTSKSCGRNAIESSLSSSRMWKQNHLKRSLQSDEREAVSVVPPKKVSRATDVSGLISDGKRKDLEKSKETAVEEVEASNEEKLEENGHTKLGIPPRLRKRAVFTTIHRGKQAKPPSPNQITAADLNEDRQRARERIRLMRQLLRDETAPTKETPKDADKPLLPVAKSPPTASSSTSSSGLLASSSGLLSTSSAFPTVSSSMTKPNQTDVDGSFKSAKGKGLLDQLLKEDPITKKLAQEAKKNATPPKSSLSNTSSGLSLFNATTTTTTKTSALSVSISNPPPSSSSPSKPTSLLQALSGMRPTTQPDQTPPVTTLSSSGGLGFQIGQSNQANTVTTSLLPSAIPTTFSSSTNAAIMTGTSNGATKTTAATAVAQPTFSFGSSSLSGTSSAQVLSTPAQPSFQFGSLTSSSASQVSFKPPADPPKPVAAQPSFSFGAASSNPLIMSGAQTQVSGASQPLAKAPVGSSNAFSFGNPAGSKQSSTGSNMPSFGATSAALSNQATQNKVSFGTSAPAFNFGATTTVQQPGPSSSFSFGGGGGVTAAATTQSSRTPSAGQFTFGAKSSSSTVPLALFQQTPSQVAATAPSASTGTSSPFTFGGATTKPASFSTSTAASSAVAPPSYNFGSQPTASAGFSFGSNQSKPPSQGSLFSSSQPSQPSGFSFGSQSAAPAPLFPAASATPPQRQQQAGFAFGNQQSQPTGLFQSSTSAPSLNFGAGNQATPSASSSFFQFGGSTGGAPAQQQTTPSSNFPGNPSKFPFGSGTSTPQFGQGQNTPAKPQSGFSMGTSSAPKKTAAARMRQRARISRR